MAKIEKDDGCLIFSHEVGGRRYSFNVDYLPEDKHDWFCEVVGRQMGDIDRLARLETAHAVRSEIHRALGLTK
jgi:hypothetical protein